MLIQECLVAYLAAQVPSAGKGYPVEVPQDAAYPSWTYQVIDDEELIAHDGATGFFKARIQIDVMAEETASLDAYGNSATIAAAMRAKLNGFKGLMGTVAVKFCKTVISDDFADLHQLPSVRFDVLINYRQS